MKAAGHDPQERRRWEGDLTPGFFGRERGCGSRGSHLTGNVGAGAGWTAEGPLGPSLAVVLAGRRPLETHPLGAGDIPGGNSAWALAAACACLPVAVGVHRQRKAPREVTFKCLSESWSLPL